MISSTDPLSSSESHGKVPPGLFAGHPRFRDADLAATAAKQGLEAAWRGGYRRHGPSIAGRVDGDFAVAFHDSDGHAFLAVDRFSICALCYRLQGGQLDFAERADELAGQATELDPQAIFDYLYFHVIPAPRTIFREVRRMPAGYFGHLENGNFTTAQWWTPTFDEGARVPFARLQREFRDLLREAVARQSGAGAVGCFLSGGTDSSTVAGMLGAVTGKPARTFSIGFDAEGYDEMEYARLAARHFKTDHHEYYVTPDDLVQSIADVAASFDQPFGNSSVLPAYYCAKMARDAGVERILAGDGGDELFGGNTRYAKQRIFQLYERLPQALRRGLLEPLLVGTSIPGRLPGISKVASYVGQSRVPMPDRLQSYNLLMHLGLDQVLTPEFLGSVDVDTPLREQRRTYAACSAQSMVNRMLAFDWKYTLADSDLPKVRGAASLAGVEVAFPLLDDRLVDFALRLDPAWKLKGLKLRWFFKEALRGFLPDPILAKRKHGFGLPFGAWLNRHAGLRALASDSLDSLRSRGLVRTDFLQCLSAEYLPRRPEYYGEMVWILLMLEHWLLAHTGSAGQRARAQTG